MQWPEVVLVWVDLLPREGMHSMSLGDIYFSFSYIIIDAYSFAAMLSSMELFEHTVCTGTFTAFISYFHSASLSYIIYYWYVQFCSHAVQHGNCLNICTALLLPLFLIFYSDPCVLLLMFCLSDCFLSDCTLNKNEMNWINALKRSTPETTSALWLLCID